MPEITIKPSVGLSTSNEPVGISLEPHLLTFFSMDSNNTSTNDKQMMSDIGNYLKGKEPFEAIDELRNIRFRLGTPQIGITPLQHIHKYIKLRASIKEQESQLKALEDK